MNLQIIQVIQDTHIPKGTYLAHRHTQAHAFQEVKHFLIFGHNQSLSFGNFLLCKFLNCHEKD